MSPAISARSIMVLCHAEPRQLDVRVRENSDYNYFCQKYIYTHSGLVLAEQTKEYSENVPIIIKVEMLQVGTDKFRNMYFKANNIYKYYDTEEVIKIQEMKEEHGQKVKKTD